MRVTESLETRRNIRGKLDRNSREAAEIARTQYRFLTPKISLDSPVTQRLAYRSYNHVFGMLMAPGNAKVVGSSVFPFSELEINLTIMQTPPGLCFFLFGFVVFACGVVRSADKTAGSLALRLALFWRTMWSGARCYESLYSR